MARLILLLVACALVLALKVEAKTTKGIVKSAGLTAQTTEACKGQGGFCLPSNECPKDKLASVSGLCGASMECCHSLPDSISDCSERGGMCRLASECKGAPRDPLGNCAGGQVCCVLI